MQPYENNSTADFASLEDIRDAVSREGGVLSLRMLDIRNAYGADRLGIHVRAGIHGKLAGLGIGHTAHDGSPELPDSQSEMVRLYQLGSPVAQLIDAVLQPSTGHDEEIRTAAGGAGSELIQRIRELVCA